jgi:hypothetical protein
MLDRLEGILKISDAEVMIQHDRSHGPDHQGSLAVTLCIVTAEPLPPDVRLRIHRMFSREFPRSEIHFRSEIRKGDE